MGRVSKFNIRGFSRIVVEYKFICPDEKAFEFIQKISFLLKIGWMGKWDFKLREPLSLYMAFRRDFYLDQVLLQNFVDEKDFKRSQGEILPFENLLNTFRSYDLFHPLLKEYGYL